MSTITIDSFITVGLLLGRLITESPLEEKRNDSRRKYLQCENYSFPVNHLTTTEYVNARLPVFLGIPFSEFDFHLFDTDKNLDKDKLVQYIVRAGKNYFATSENPFEDDEGTGEMEMEDYDYSAMSIMQGYLLQKITKNKQIDGVIQKVYSTRSYDFLEGRKEKNLVLKVNCSFDNNPITRIGIPHPQEVDYLLNHFQVSHSKDLVGKDLQTLPDFEYFLSAYMAKSQRTKFPTNTDSSIFKNNNFYKPITQQALLLPSKS